MKTTSPEFIIVNVVCNEDNLLPGPYCVVVGRCGDSPIMKGDVFLAAYRYKTSLYPEEMGDDPVRVEEVPVRLEVAEIQTHNRSFDQLGQGMTGQLFARGEGLDCLAPGWVIGQPVPSPSPERASSVTTESVAARRQA
jgi:hypothetical protein